MGADLFMRSPSFHDRLRGVAALFDYGCDLRDAEIQKLGEESAKRDPTGHSFVNPAVQGWQRSIDLLWRAIHAPDVYWSDGYNRSILAARLGFSWWRDVTPHTVPTRVEDERAEMDVLIYRHVEKRFWGPKCRLFVGGNQAKNRTLSPDACARLADRIAWVEVKPLRMADWAASGDKLESEVAALRERTLEAARQAGHLKEGDKVMDDVDEGTTDEEWQAHFAERRDELVKFLRAAAATDGLEVSL